MQSLFKFRCCCLMDGVVFSPNITKSTFHVTMISAFKMNKQRTDRGLIHKSMGSWTKKTFDKGFDFSLHNRKFECYLFRFSIKKNCQAKEENFCVKKGLRVLICSMKKMCVIFEVVWCVLSFAVNYKLWLAMQILLRKILWRHGHRLWF